ncbi:MAG: AMP-binding protein [Gemmatimonadaceae bacterium]
MSTASPIVLRDSAYVDSFARDGLPSFDQWPELNTQAPFDYPDRLNAAVELLDNAVREGHGDRVAIITRDANGGLSEVTYRSLQQQVDAIAHVLVNDLGLITGNRVLLRGYNGAMLAATWLAVIKAGGIAVTTMPMLRAGELQAVLQKSACRFALCDARLAADFQLASDAYAGLYRALYWSTENDPDSLNALMHQYDAPFTAIQTSADDVCLIAFTSGTTGVPKGCMHFHRDVMAMCDGFSAQVLRLASDDRCIGTPPLAFTFGLGALLVFPMHARASTVLVESATPESLLDVIAATRATVTATAPTFYRLMSLAMQREPARFDTSSLRQSISAGEALPTATRTAWRAASGIEMLDGIGATEMIHIFIAATGADVREGAIGKAVTGYEVAILDEQFQPVAAGETGRLAVRGPTGCRYLADARQTAYVQHGWNLTGDACTMDADGYVYFKARTDDLIISSGYNIGAPEVEAAVLLHEAVAECAVIGVPDDERGQCVKAFVVLKPSFNGNAELIRQIQDHVKQTVAPYKYPRLVEFRDALPKTETGKLQRFRLRE